MATTTSLPATGLDAGARAESHGPSVEPPTPLQFDIVPRLGIVIAAVAVVLVVAAIAADRLWPLVFLHVTGGAAWTIIDLFLGLVLGPIMGSMSIPARVEFTTRLMPKMVIIMPVVVSMTLAAGWQLAAHMGTIASSYPQHGWIVASFVIVGVMAVLALGLLEPANIAVLYELKKPRPNLAVIERLMKRFIYCAGVLGVMQIATLVIMTVDRLVMSAVGHDAPAQGSGAPEVPAERPHPPFTQVGMASLAMIVIGGIYLSAHIPAHVSLGPAVALLLASALALAYNVFSLTRVEGFAWWRFAQVAKWALLAYATIAGMIEFAFLENHVSGGTLVVLTLSLVVFAIEVPTLIAFTVARYAPSTPEGWV